MLYKLDCLLYWKYSVPVILHRYDDPAIGICLIKGFIQRSDVTFPIIGILAFPIGVVHEQTLATADVAVEEHIVKTTSSKRDKVRCFLAVITNHQSAVFSE